MVITSFSNTIKAHGKLTSIYCIYVKSIYGNSDISSDISQSLVLRKAIKKQF